VWLSGLQSINEAVRPDGGRRIRRNGGTVLGSRGGGKLVASRELERIRNAVLDGQYTLTEHAYDEMDADGLDVLDIEAAILTGEIEQALTMDPRGTRYVVIGEATDQQTPIGVVVRFVEHNQLLVITVYEIK
jgi:hypothetical protein